MSIESDILLFVSVGGCLDIVQVAPCSMAVTSMTPMLMLLIGMSCSKHVLHSPELLHFSFAQYFPPENFSLRNVPDYCVFKAGNTGAGAANIILLILRQILLTTVFLSLNAP